MHENSICGYLIGIKLPGSEASYSSMRDEQEVSLTVLRKEEIFPTGLYQLPLLETRLWARWALGPSLQMDHPWSCRTAGRCVSSMHSLAPFSSAWVPIFILHLNRCPAEGHRTAAEPKPLGRESSKPQKSTRQNATDG